VGLRRRQRDDPCRHQTSTASRARSLTHFDRNGFAYTLDRVTGELLVAEKFDPKVNWATGVDMDKN
jgi:glucose dehydrogenase